MFWSRYRAGNGLGARLGRLIALLHLGFRLLLILLIVDLFYLAVTWPDWKQIAAGPVPKSGFIGDYQHEHREHRDLPPLRWQPVPLSAVPKYLIRAVILAEDSRFYEHSGFDLIAFKEAMDLNFTEGRLAAGGSTLSQQTVKNLFLSSSRNPLRKWHELILTWGMEQNLSKHRILEIYLNVAEFGQGIYGVQAAAQAYWGVNVERLSPTRAAELAATLPSPVKNNPVTRTQSFDKRYQRVLRLLTLYPGDAADAMTGADALVPASEDRSPAGGERAAPETTQI